MIKLKYLHAGRDKTGKPHYHVRIHRGKRVFLRSEFGTAKFMIEYEEAIKNYNRRDLTPPKKVRSANTFGGAVDLYLQSKSWLSLAAETRRNRQPRLKALLNFAANEDIADIKAATIRDFLATNHENPHKCRDFINVMRHFFDWAMQSNIVVNNPCDGIAAPKIKKISGYEAWTEKEISAYENYYSLGTIERLWFAVLLNTGARRTDAVQLGRKNIDSEDGLLTFKTSKSGGKIRVKMPLAPELSAAIAAIPAAAEAEIWIGRKTKSNGYVPISPTYFAHAFRQAADAVGINKSAHGLRKSFAIRLALSGATIPEMMAMCGWTTATIAAYYIEQADRIRMAQNGYAKLQKYRQNNLAAPIV